MKKVILITTSMSTKKIETIGTTTNDVQTIENWMAKPFKNLVTSADTETIEMRKTIA